MGVATAVLRAAVEQETGQRLIFVQMGSYAAADVSNLSVDVSNLLADVSVCSTGGACLNVQTWARG
jgi:hypothetical protein